MGIHSEELINLGREAGIKLGRELGKKEVIVPMVKNMLKEGMDLELIKKVLRPDHSEDEIQEILRLATSAA